MNPIGRRFGFFVLVLSGFGMSYLDEPTASCVCLVGAVLFDAIKTIKQN